MPFQADLRTNGTDDGIFTSTAGSSPNRLFGIFWNAHYFASANFAKFAVLFHESNPRIEAGYFATADAGLSAVSGVQASGTGPLSQFSCQTAFLTNGSMVTYRPTAGLAIGKKGTGKGRVKSSPAGITCGSACSAVYDVRTKVTLTASPRKGSRFAGWSGGGCSGKGGCTVTISAPTTVTARFTKLCPGYLDDPRRQIAGTRRGDLLLGTKGNDIICGLDGKDEIRGKGGNDLLLGGGGTDRLIGGPGKDVALGGPRDDHCFAEVKQSC